MKYQYFISFLFIFLQYIFINNYLYGYSYPHHFRSKQERYFANELKYLFYQPRTHGSNALNTTITFLSDMINNFYHNSNYTDLLQFFPHKYSTPYIASTNSFNIYTIHNDVNTSIFYFHKTNDSSDIINFSKNAKNARKDRRKNLMHDKKRVKDIYYHKNSKPLIIVCKVDTNPLRASTFDTSIHIFAITEAIETILNSKNITDKIKHDFAFVFTGCEEFDQLGTKYIIKNAFENGGYYLYLSGVGVGRPLALFSQSKKSSSVIKALSKVTYIPMATFTSELEDFISLIKAKSFSMIKVKQQTAPKNEHKSKSKSTFNSDATIESKTSSFNLNFLKKQGFEKEYHNYKYRYHLYNGATKIQKNKNFAGAELSFIGNPLIHSTASDMDSDAHNVKNVQLVVHSILHFLMHFDTKSTENDISKESYTVAFGISPLVFLIQKETLNLISFFLILLFCFYIVFYLVIQIYHKLNENERADIFNSINFVLKDEFSFIFCYFSALALTFICYFLFFLLLSVMNTSAIVFKPNLYLFLITFSIFTVFICIFEYLINNSKLKNYSSDQFNSASFYLDDDWHFLQVIYITLLLIIFRKFDFEILIVVTTIFFIIYQFCPVHKNLVWTPVFLSIFILCPFIFTYALLYRPFLLDCQNLPIFYADIVPFIFIFLFFTHISVFTLPFYYAKEKQKQNAESQTNPERLKIHYLCAISQILYAFNKIDNISSTSETEISEDNKKSNDKKLESSNLKTNVIKNRNKANKKESANIQSNSDKKSNNNNSLQSSVKNKIETIISSKKLIILNSFILLFLLFFNWSSFNNEIPIKGTFAHYYYKDSNKSEISFIPQNGRRLIPFLWKSLSKTANISYVYNYKGRLLTDPRPAFVKTVENSSLPFFFTLWPQISLSSIQHDVPNKRRVAIFDDENEDENNEIKKDKKPKVVRKILFNLHSSGPNINFIYFIFKCGTNLNAGQCVDSRIRLVDPIDQSTISYLHSQKSEEKLFNPFFSDNGETVFRIGSFVGNQIKRIPQIEINVTLNTQIKLTIAYQSFIETKEMKDFQSKFNKIAVNEINSNEVTQSVFIQTQMI